MQRIAVLGCGNGGQAFAADLSLKACDVTLYADPKHSTALKKIQNTHQITLEGVRTGTAKINCLTTNIAEAINNKDIIYIVLPTYAHESTFIKILPHLTKGQIIVTVSSNFSSLCFLELQKQYDYVPDVIWVDIHSLPYACRATMPGHVNIYAIKESIKFSTLPSWQVTQAIRKLEKHFPSKLIPLKSVIEVGLNNLGGVIHPTIALLNAGRIGEGKDAFYFYKEGVTPAIANLLEKIDADRIEIGRRYGYTIPSCLEVMRQWYGISYDNLYDFFIHSPIHHAITGPNSLDDRYLIQDIPYLLVPWFHLGLAMGYRSTAIYAVIQMASELMNINFLQNGRTLERMGLSQKTPTQIELYLHGKKNDLNTEVTC